MVLSSPVQRVMDSAYFFAQGFFGHKAKNVTFRTVADLDDPVSWITPWKSCPTFPDDESHEVKFVDFVEAQCSFTARAAGLAVGG